MRRGVVRRGPGPGPSQLLPLLSSAPAGRRLQLLAPLGKPAGIPTHFPPGYPHSRVAGKQKWTSEMTSSLGGCCFHTRRGLGTGWGWGAEQGGVPDPQTSSSEGSQNTVARTETPVFPLLRCCWGAAVWPLSPPRTTNPSSMSGPRPLNLPHRDLPITSVNVSV